MIYADLHIHSRYSDGSLDLDDLLTRIKNSGLRVFALSDHDKSDHYPLVRNKADDLGLRAIKATEMSCYDYDVDKKVHILALFMKDESPNIERLTQNTLRVREDNHKILIKNLKDKGYDIDYKFVKKFAPHSIVFKSHILEALRDKYPNKNFTYKNTFKSQKDIETNRKMGYIDVFEAIKACLKDGAVPFIAHPFLYDSYPRIEKYVDSGLKGIEVKHSKMTREDYELSKKLAKKYSLLISGGSDFHDPSKDKLGIFGLSKEEFMSLDQGVRSLD
ncbi:MAG: PHP domain-containing protein [Anaerococcus sp.]|nr:PHP domain-containing protein [Anaerococcus sp.]